jgi:hypothetical protein
MSGCRRGAFAQVAKRCRPPLVGESMTEHSNSHLRPWALRTSQGEARAVSARLVGGTAAAADAAPSAPAARSSCGLSAGTAHASTLSSPRIVFVLPVPARLSAGSHESCCKPPGL